MSRDSSEAGFVWDTMEEGSVFFLEASPLDAAGCGKITWAAGWRFPHQMYERRKR